MQQEPIIHILDDDPRVRNAIAQLVKPIRVKVKTFSQPEDFLSDFHDDGPACLVLAVRMPAMSGLELQSRLIHAGCKMPLVFVTGHADVRMAVDAMKAGAANFLEKPFRPQELFDEIQKALRDDIEAWKCRDDEQRIEGKLAVLKPGEREVLELIMQGKTNKKIAQELQLSVRGVEARRAKAMRTLRVDSKSELLQLIPAPTPCNSPKSSL